MTPPLMHKFDGNQVYNLTPEFRTLVALEKIDGVSQIKKFAYNPSCPANIERDVWDFGATNFGNRDYIYPADNTAPIDSISSSDGGDTQNVVIEGLDISGNEIQDEAAAFLNIKGQVITLDGQNKVTIPIPMWRVHRMYSIDAQSVSDRSKGFTGNIYCYEDTAISGGIPVDLAKVRSFIFDGNNQTLMSQYTIPKGRLGIFTWDSSSIVIKQAVNVLLTGYSRAFGSVWRLINVEGLNSQGSTTIESHSNLYSSIPEKTDLVVAANSGTVGIGFSARFDILLFDKEKWSLS